MVLWSQPREFTRTFKTPPKRLSLHSAAKLAYTWRRKTTITALGNSAVNWHVGIGCSAILSTRHIRQLGDHSFFDFFFKFVNICWKGNSKHFCSDQKDEWKRFQHFSTSTDPQCTFKLSLQHCPLSVQCFMHLGLGSDSLLAMHRPFSSCISWAYKLHRHTGMLWSNQQPGYWEHKALWGVSCKSHAWYCNYLLNAFQLASFEEQSFLFAMY